MAFRFDFLATDPTGARLGRLTTPHGVIDTPGRAANGDLPHKLV
jgi:hypothetical protein